LILSGTTGEMMRSLYARPHRSSIYEPATIHDIPQEVLEKSLILLLPSINDLIAASEACRAWRPVAQQLIHSRLTIDHHYDVGVESLLCGYRLNYLVFGSSSLQIYTLSLDVYRIRKEYIPIVAQIVSSTLSSLNLDFNGDEDVSVTDIDCNETITAFFSQCRWIRNLRLVQGVFGDDADMITPTIKEGFSRLNQFSLIDWHGDVRLFMESTPIPNLKSFLYESNDTSPDEDIDIVDAAVTNYGRSLITLNLDNCFMSSGNLVKIAECCLELQKLTLTNTEDDDVLSLADMKIIASLPRLESLKIGEYCRIPDGAVKALTRCRNLIHLSVNWQDGLIDVLRVIGKPVVSLVLWEMNVEEIDRVVEFCPNLQYLELGIAGRMLALKIEM
jgi:hypothetical protein